MTRPAAWLLTFVAACAAAAASPADVVAEALRGQGGDIPAQARTLASLAWTKPDVPAAVRVEARGQLVGYGDHGIPAIREVIRTDVGASGDAVAALIEARAHVPSGIPIDFFVALDEALWFGSEEAKRLAIPYLASNSSAFNVLPMIDAAEEYPALTSMVAYAIGVSRNPRGRFWLDGVLHGTRADAREEAARSLALLGTDGVALLRAALDDRDPAVRRAAMDALLPLASPVELPELYRFLETHGAADPPLADRVRARTAELELLRHGGSSGPPR